MKRVIGHRVAILEHAETDGERGNGESVGGKRGDGSSERGMEKAREEKETEDVESDGGNEMARSVLRRISRRENDTRAVGEK
jgi:hypothetical protein